MYSNYIPLCLTSKLQLLKGDKKPQTPLLGSPENDRKERKHWKQRINSTNPNDWLNLFQGRFTFLGSQKIKKN